MARLLKFNGAQSLPGVGSPQVVADTAVGDALVGLGGQIGSSAEEIGGLMKAAQNAYKDPKKKQEPTAKQSQRMARPDLEARNRATQQAIDAIETNKAIFRHVTTVKNNEAAILEKAGPGGVGYTEKALEYYDAEQERLASTLPENVTRPLRNVLSDRRANYLNRSAAQENAENQNYLRREYDETLVHFQNQVLEDPESLDDALLEVRNLAAIMPLPATEKAKKTKTFTEKLTETWVGTRPLDEQIAGLTKLKAGREPPGERSLREKSGPGISGPVSVRSEAQGVAVSSGDEENSKTHTPTEFEVRARVLPPQTQNRLLAGAKKKKAAKALQEEQQIRDRIDTAPDMVDTAEIESNVHLEPHQKLQLLNHAQEAVLEQKKDLEAVDWVGTSARALAGSRGDQERTDRAYRVLADDSPDQDVLARGIFRQKGILPKSYLASQVKSLNSSDPAELGRAYKNLSVLARIDPGVLKQGRKGDGLQSALTKWEVLTEHLGLTEEEATSRLAKANAPAQRAALLRENSADYPNRSADIADSDGVLQQMARTGYSSNGIPATELLKDVDFIER